MKQLSVPILLILVMISGLLAACTGTVATDKEAAERDKAVAFYKGAHPIAEEIADSSDDWNDFMEYDEKYGASPYQFINTCQELQSRLSALQYDLSMLYAPEPLRQLKSDMALSISTGIEAFSLGEQCATVPEFDSCNQADNKLLELTRLMMLLADEWDDGLAYYDIKASEILQ